jgi:signal transduction histidine kinase
MVAGRVLAPIGRITAVARDIGATDLSRRIALRGPPDELRELADTFDAMLARLEDAFASQQRFIQEASHELRNPLAVIRTNLDVALADPDASAEDLRRTAELVGRNATRMSTLVDDLVVYGRRGSPSHEVGPVDLAAVVAEGVEEFAAPARLRDLDVVGDAAPGLTVTGDRVALRRAVANLIANAVRLAPPGSTVAVGAGSDGERCWVAVADEGPGIAAEARELVFQRFWRGDAAGAREEGRSGLGLAIVDQVARDHGGTVELTDSSSGGSVFTIWLPLPADG